jgi:hypothetical protein
VAVKPQDFTPLAQLLFSVILFLLAAALGSATDTKKAAQAANDRWLPQAESVILRLMTLRAEVVKFSYETKDSCGTPSCDIPELDTEAFRMVRIRMKDDCHAASGKLDNIAHQLDDAIADWQRFVTANCQGDECARIFYAFQEREDKLQRELAELKAAKTLSTVRGGLAAPLATAPSIQPAASSTPAKA